MSAPTSLAMAGLKRIGRYLEGQRRLVIKYPWQTDANLEGYSDTDWAGCAKTRKSTSGGCILLGKHTIKHWSSTQPTISLSSGEAEFYGVVKGSGYGLGYQSLLKDLDTDVQIRVWTDSSASIGICSRQGLGKLRHIDTHTLWIQQAIRTGRINLKKVLGSENPADLLTKHNLTREKLEQLILLYGCRYEDGRPEVAPKMRTGSTGKRLISEAESVPDEGRHVAQEEEEERAITSYDEHTPPKMPHNQLSTEQLDEQYPSLEVPDECELNDLEPLEADHLYNKGMKEVQSIISAMHERGRTRKPHTPSTN